MADLIRSEIFSLKNEMIKIRRDFHRHPEIGFNEKRTSEMIAKYLNRIDLKVETEIAKTGVMGLLIGNGSGRTILLRADMDALPIHEKNMVAYRSTTHGLMHACGHDGHMAIVLTVAKILSRRRKEFSGQIKFIFQPAEEELGGAKPMIDANVMNDPKVDVAIALHLWNSLPLGTVGIRSGPAMASMDSFTIKLYGKAGHGAMAHQAVDTIVMSGQVLSAIQTIASREIAASKPVVVHVGTIHGGFGFNIVAEQVELRGTVRTLDDRIRKGIPQKMKRIIKGVTRAMRGNFELDYRFGYPVLVNDSAVTGFVREIAAKVVGNKRVIEIEPTMVGEDMAFFLRKVPGCFFFVGAGKRAKHMNIPHHNPSFDFDENAMLIGAEILSKVALDYLAPVYSQ